MLPLKIIYPDKEYSDGVDITPQEIYQRMPQALPTTSLPDGGTLLSLLDEIKSQGFEKVIAICQKRVVTEEELKPGFWAKVLSRFVHQTSAGPGMGLPIKMQFAINVCGLPKDPVGRFPGRHR